MNPNEPTSCPACEDGTCLEHETETPEETDDAVSLATKEELLKTRRDVARSVKRLNRAIKAARAKTPAPDPIPTDPLPSPPAPPKHNDVTRLGLRFLDGCRRKGK